jgi:ABC-type nitrate/sulfonate/bicarbonate transport system substrate-binding protein
MARRSSAVSVLVGLLSVALLLPGLGCSKGTDQQANDGKKQAVRVGYSRLRISLPVFVAKEKGIFAKHGIEAELEMYDTAQPLMQALVAGKVDVAGYTALPITFNGMLRSKKQLYFITTMVEDQSHRISFLLRPATPEGQAIKSPKDLKGKRIGILPTIAYKAWLQEILKANGLDPETDVTIVQVAPEQTPQAIKSGGVDALFTNDPAATAAIRLGVAELVSQEVECPKYIMDPFPFGSFNVSKEWADANPDLFKKLVAALDEAAAFVNAHPEEAKACMAPYLRMPSRMTCHGTRMLGI